MKISLFTLLTIICTKSICMEEDNVSSKIYYSSELKNFAKQVNKSIGINEDPDISIFFEPPYNNPIATKLRFKPNNSESKEFLSTDNIYKLIPKRLPIKNSKDLFEKDNKLKKEIAFADMSDMVIIEEGSLKTSIMTPHVYPCVAVLAYNLVSKKAGIAHIPGMADEERSLKKMHPIALQRGVNDFLQSITYKDNTNDEELHKLKQSTIIHLIGGYKNRYLLLSLVKEISETMGYPLDAENIFYGGKESIKYDDDNVKFDDHIINKFNLEITLNGEIFILQDKKLIEKNYNLPLSQIKYLWSSGANTIDGFNEYLENKDPSRGYRINQFSILTMKTYQQNGKKEKFIFIRDDRLLYHPSAWNNDILKNALLQEDIHFLANILTKKYNNPILYPKLNYTLLHFASANNIYSMVYLLLQKGADPTIKTTYGMNSIEMTTNDNIKKLLKIYIK